MLQLNLMAAATCYSVILCFAQLEKGVFTAVVHTHATSDLLLFQTKHCSSLEVVKVTLKICPSRRKKKSLRLHICCIFYVPCNYRSLLKDSFAFGGGFCEDLGVTWWYSWERKENTKRASVIISMYGNYA